MALTVCSFCGRRIRRKPSQIKRSAFCFCSKECHNLSMKKGSNVFCDWCGKIFYKALSEIREENFCSAECRNHWLSRQNREVMNVEGHSKGHKAPHLSELNKRRNPLGSIAENQVEVPSYRYRRIVESLIGRKLHPDEVIHHINGIRTDNRIENLRILTRSEHSRLHMEIALKKSHEGGGALCQKR